MDVLIRLYALPPPPESPDSVAVRRALAPERGLILDWVEEHFSRGWASEAAVTFGGQPIRCLVAVRAGAPVGFACYNATFRGFFGPFGVAETERGRGIGEALCHRALLAMREEGYAYAVAGATKAPEWFEKRFAAMRIPDSWPGAYEGLLGRKGKLQEP